MKRLKIARKPIAFTFIAAVMSLLHGCASFDQPMAVTDALQPNQAYIYGNFMTGPGFGHDGMVFENIDDGTRRRVEFVRQDRITVMPLNPGRYRASKVLFADQLYEIMASADIKNGPLARTFTVEAGKAYYFGDITLGALDVETFGIYSQTITYGLTDVRFRYDRSTRMLREEYPALRDVGTTPIFPELEGISYSNEARN